MQNPSALSLKQRQALEEALLAGTKKSTSNHGIQTKILPLTPGQESLWFLEQFRPELPTYNVAQAFELSGTLDLNVLEKALRTAGIRHESLRSRLVLQGEKPWMEVMPGDQMSFEFEDYSEFSPEVAEDKARTSTAAHSSRLFNLQSDSFYRVKLIRLNPGRHILAFCFPHLVSDMSSLHLLYREIRHVYQSLVNDGETRELEPAIQFRDFLQQASASSDPKNLDRDLSFWRNELKDATPGQPLVGDKPSEKRRSGKGRLYYFNLDAGLAGALNDLGKREGASLYMVLLTAWRVLLHRYSSQEDILIGAPFSQRDFPGAERMFGYLINLLIFRSRIAGEPTFAELLRDTRVKALNLYDHPRVPFSSIVQELKLPRDGGANPLAPNVFQYLPEGVARFELPGVDSKVIPVDNGTAKFDLTLTIAGNGGNLLGELEYSTDLFSDNAIRRMGQHYVELLSAAVRSPGVSINSLNLLPAGERELVLNTWNATNTPFPQDKTVSQVFEEIVSEHGGKTAVQTEDKEISYAELNETANRLANYLARRGVVRGDRVGICLPRGVDLVKTILAVLKAGACFVPIDPKYPSDRVRAMASAAGLKLVIAGERSKALEAGRTDLLILGDHELAIAREQSGNPKVQSSSEDECYIMYTSGSTGLPKGVAVPHRAVTRLVRNTNFARFGPDETFLLFAPATFDASTLEIWGALLNGGKLAIYPPEFESIDQFREVVIRHKITTLWLTAGFFNSVVDHDVSCLRGVTQLLVGGDVLSVPHVSKALAALPETQIINGYGPTENTTFTCCYSIPRDLPGDRPVPIGRPIANTQAYILDKNLNPVPIGVIGGLYAGGDGLALGYVNDSELTRDRFIPNPFSPEGGRLYKTGDFARFREDGVIEFFGRMDGQVKIRGFRIEPGEVELAIKRIPGIKDAVVVPFPDSGGNKSLAAYVIQEGDRTITAEALRGELKILLPEFMVPSTITFMDAFPLNQNGKVNKNALPHPARETPGNDAKELPLTPTESRLLELWKEVLCVPDLGVTDNFFDLGGHSLLATRIVSRINQSFSARMAVSEIFNTPTVRGLARRIEEKTEPQAAKETMARRGNAGEILNRIDSLNEEDLDALLKEHLK